MLSSLPSVKTNDLTTNYDIQNRMTQRVLYQSKGSDNIIQPPSAMVQKPTFVPFLPPAKNKETHNITSTITQPEPRTILQSSVTNQPRKGRKGYGKTKNMNQKKEPQIYCSTKPKPNSTGNLFLYFKYNLY